MKLSVLVFVAVSTPGGGGQGFLVTFAALNMADSVETAVLALGMITLGIMASALVLARGVTISGLSVASDELPGYAELLSLEMSVTTETGGV